MVAKRPRLSQRPTHLPPGYNGQTSPYIRVCPACYRSCQDCGWQHDPCIKDLPNTSDACCGHGWPSRAYVILHTGEVLEGRKALRYFMAHKGHIWFGAKAKHGPVPRRQEWG